MCFEFFPFECHFPADFMLMNTQMWKKPSLQKFIKSLRWGHMLLFPSITIKVFRILFCQHPFSLLIRTLEGMIQLAELSRRRIRSVNKLIRGEWHLWM